MRKCLRALTFEQVGQHRAHARNVQSCDLVGLPDLCTGCEHVQATVSAYLSRLSELGVAGVRIDAAKHQDSGELGQLLSRAAGNLYSFHEVISGPSEAVQPSMYFSLGQVTEFNYARQLAPNILAEGDVSGVWAHMRIPNELRLLQSAHTSATKADPSIASQGTKRSSARLTPMSAWLGSLLDAAEEATRQDVPTLHSQNVSHHARVYLQFISRLESAHVHALGNVVGEGHSHRGESHRNKHSCIKHAVSSMLPKSRVR